jgi:AmmeMemoRadiSam system protein B
MRKAVFAGKLYENEFDTLSKQIEGCFEKGPGDLPLSVRNKEMGGVVVPVCNYAVSGDVGAWGFKEIAESKFPEVYVLIGGCEGDKGYLSMEDFETPLGVVGNMKLYSRTENVEVNEEKHKEARDIEILLPFLQYISKDKLRELRIMPILIGDKCSYETLLEIGSAIRSIDKSFVVIGGCNLSYFGEKYGNTPFRYNVVEEIKNVDMVALGFAQTKEREKFWKFTDKFDMKCKNVMTVVLELVEKCELLEYGDSSKVTGDKEFISYCSLGF